MASVYKVRHTQLRSVYALKVLDGALGRMQDRLLREGRVQATLRHPNIVSVHDVLEVGGQPALLMEYISGPTLSAHILANEPLEVEEIDRLARGIIKGVRAAHAAGHLHRDLKPSNILLEPLDGEWIPKIADFGLVKVLRDPMDPTQTRTGQLLGSPAYMSPEQTISGSDLDHRTDVWALGTVLYQLVTGRLAFPHRDLVTVFSMIRSGDFRDPRALRERIPDRMWNAILGAMTVDSERRIQDTDQLLEVWVGQTAFDPEVVRSLDTAEEFLHPALPTADMPTDGPPTSSRAPLTWAGLGAALLIVLLAILVGTQLVPRSDPPEVPAEAPPEQPEQPPPAPAPEPVAPAPPPVEPEPTPPSPPTRAKRPAPVQVPAPAEVPSPEPEPQEPTPGSFSVQGDAERVWLVRDGTFHDPGPVPAGRYTIAARFPGRPQAPIEGVVVEIAAGGAAVVECRAGFFTCRAL